MVLCMLKGFKGTSSGQIRLAGGNKYKEGIVHEPLLPCEEELDYRVQCEWAQISATKEEAELQTELEAKIATMVDKDD